MALMPAPAHTSAPRRRSLESPDLLMLSGERWQFFGTLTFKRERMPERVRPSMFNAAFRQLAKELHLHFPRLAWCRREELGEHLGRRHYHFLLTGLPARAVNISTCFFLMHAWEKNRNEDRADSFASSAPLPLCLKNWILRKLWNFTKRG